MGEGIGRGEEEVEGGITFSFTPAPLLPFLSFSFSFFFSFSSSFHLFPWKSGDCPMMKAKEE